MADKKILTYEQLLAERDAYKAVVFWMQYQIPGPGDTVKSVYREFREKAFDAWNKGQAIANGEVDA